MSEQDTVTPSTAHWVTTADALSAIRRERVQWEELIASIPAARQTEAGVMGQWSFTHLVSHLTAWSRYAIARLRAAAQGHPNPPPPWPATLHGDDAINAWIYEHASGRPPELVMTTWLATVDQLAEVVAAMPEAHLNDPGSVPWEPSITLGPALVDGTWFDHYHNEHEPDVRAWLARSAD